MKQIFFEYDHYLGESVFRDGGQNKCDWLDSQLNKKEDLEFWASEFLHELMDEYNEAIEFEFMGIQQDCETMEDTVTEFNKTARLPITLVCRTKTTSKSGGAASLADLRKLYEEVNSIHCPFEVMRENKEIQDAFDKGANKEFEIAVVATMSSGKSTLINAMLGKELLPARNEATTATITRIHDTLHDRFFCEYVDGSGQVQHIDPVSLDDMNRLNSDGIPDINIYGKIYGIDSHALNLVLADTPGPNNSRTSDHKDHTYRLIKDSKFKPMILYVLNSTQLETNDDNTLLHEIAEAMRTGGRQASDRFIFVMNKADEFDTEKGESVERMMKKTEDYLSKHGITNPKLFPCSAYYAKLIRQKLSGVELTRKEKASLPGQVELFIDDEELHFSSKAKVSTEVRKVLDRKLQEAKNRDDNYEQALIHTGIPAVEEAINEYLNKYAVPAKIKESLNAFQDIIKDLAVESKADTELAKDKQELEKTQKAIQDISAELSKGDEAKRLKGEVDKLSVTEQVKATFENLCGKKFQDFNINLKKKYKGKSTVRHDEVDYLKKDVQKNVEELQGELAIDLENIINKEIGSKAKSLIEKYNKYVEKLVEKFNFTASAASLVGHLAHMRDFTADFDTDTYEFEREEVIGHHIETRTGTRIVTKTRIEERKVKRSGFGSKLKRGFGKLFRKSDWGYDWETYEVPYQVEQTYEYDEKVDDKGMVKYVDFSRMVGDYVSVVLQTLEKEARKLALEEAEEKADELKIAFKKEFDKLNEAMKEKLADKDAKLRDEEDRKKMVEQGQRNLAWIKDFQERLRDALGN